MKSILFIFVGFVFFFMSSTCFSQQPLGVKALELSPYSFLSELLVPTLDNSVLTFGANRTSICIISKIDSVGNIKWARHYDFTGAIFNARSKFMDATTCFDSTFAAIGITSTNQTNYSAFFLKLKANGDTLWCRRFVDNNYTSIIPYSISQTNDTGFVMCGLSISTYSSGPNQHAFIAKLTKNGNLSWMKTLSTSFYASYASTVKQTADSGFIAIGGVQNSSAVDWCVTLIKFNKTGNLTWHKKYCEPSTQSIISDGSDIIVEKTGFLCAISSASYQPCLIKTDLQGNMLWIKSYSKSSYSQNNTYERGLKLHKTSDGSRLIVSPPSNGNYSWLILSDTLGNTKWSASTYLIGIDAVQIKNKNFVLIGNPPIVLKTKELSLYGDVGLVITDSLGTGITTCYKTESVNTGTLMFSMSVLASSLNSSGSLSTISPTLSSLSFQSRNGCIDLGSGISENNASSIHLYPNPTNGKLIFQSEFFQGKNIHFELYDVYGKVVFSKIYITGLGSLEIDLSELSHSLYFYAILSDEQIVKTGKIILTK